MLQLLIPFPLLTQWQGTDIPNSVVLGTFTPRKATKPTDHRTGCPTGWTGTYPLLILSLDKVCMLSFQFTNHLTWMYGSLGPHWPSPCHRAGHDPQVHKRKGGKGPGTAWRGSGESSAVCCKVLLIFCASLTQTVWNPSNVNKGRRRQSTISTWVRICSLWEWKRELDNFGASSLGVGGTELRAGSVLWLSTWRRDAELTENRKLSHMFSKADPVPRKEQFFFFFVILPASSWVLEIRVWEVFERCILVTNTLLETTVKNCLQPSLFNQNISEVSCGPGWVYSSHVTTAECLIFVSDSSVVRKSFFPSEYFVLWPPLSNGSWSENNPSASNDGHLAFK